MSGKVIEDLLALSVVTLDKNRDFKGLARPQQGFLDGSRLLAKGTGPGNIIKCQYIQQRLNTLVGKEKERGIAWKWRNREAGKR